MVDMKEGKEPSDTEGRKKNKEGEKGKLRGTYKQGNG
jgi:hypothetical protein